MSNVVPAATACPRCGARRSAVLFDSVNGDVLEAHLVERARGEEPQRGVDDPLPLLFVRPLHIETRKRFAS
jgi:hypothetical protein